PFFGRFQTYDPSQPLSKFNDFDSAGRWGLFIETGASPTLSGTLNSWSLTFNKPISTSGLGEAVADQATVPFRISTFSSANPQAHGTWNPVGPAGFDPLDPFLSNDATS